LLYDTDCRQNDYKKGRGDNLTDTNLLNDSIKRSGLKRTWIAEQLGLSYFGFQKKVNNESQFKANEIKQLCILLRIESLVEREHIFFASNVDKMTTKKLKEEA
jgi:hypothetical protein